MTQTLRHKGRILDSSINSFQQLEKTLSVEDQQLLDDIISNRTELSNLYFSGLGNRSLEQYQAEVDYLKGNIQVSQHLRVISLFGDTPNARRGSPG